MDRCCTKGRAGLEVRQHARERCHVIVIEDNVETVDQVRNCLQAAGYEVEFTIDGERGSVAVWPRIMSSSPWIAYSRLSMGSQ